MILLEKNVIQNIFILFIFVCGLSLILNIKFMISVLFAKYKNKRFKNKFIFAKIIKTMFYQTLPEIKQNNV